MNEIEMSNVTYCLFNKASFCSGRDWHRDRHRSISSVASFWLTGTILLVDGLPNLARRLLASTGFTETSKIAKMKIILKAEIIFMAIEKVFFKIICLIIKIMKILRRIVTFKGRNRSFKHAMELSKNLEITLFAGNYCDILR